MSCSRTEAQLVAFHFGEVSDEVRGEVEQHLLGCRACLEGFLALKRGIELGEAEPRPSATARARLRSAVAQQLGLGLPRPGWSWWERPLAFGCAAAAVVAAMVALNALRQEAGTRPHGLTLESVPEPSGLAPSG